MKQDLAAAGLLHDWNNVLQTVAQAAGLLADDPQWSGLSRTLEAAVHRGRTLAESLTEEVCLCDLREVVERAAAGAPVRLQSSLSDTCRVQGRARALERVFANLLENSAAAGATEVCVEGNLECLEVRDNGRGIPEGLLPRLFEPGVSGRGSTGLGLHIASSIIEAHGGTLEAVNLAGGGACFRIRLVLPPKP